MKLIDAMRYLCEDDMFLSGGEPRIYRRQIAEIERRTGCLLQSESVYGAEESGPRVVNPLHKDEYILAVRALDAAKEER